MGNIDRMVSEISATESSIPPICAEALRLKKRLRTRVPIDTSFFIVLDFKNGYTLSLTVYPEACKKAIRGNHFFLRFHSNSYLSIC